MLERVALICLTPCDRIRFAVTDSDRLIDTTELASNVTAPLAESVDTASSVAELSRTRIDEADVAPEQLSDASAVLARTQFAVLVALALALASAVRTRCASDVIAEKQLAEPFEFCTLVAEQDGDAVAVELAES